MIESGSPRVRSSVVFGAAGTGDGVGVDNAEPGFAVPVGTGVGGAAGCNAIAVGVAVGAVAGLEVAVGVAAATVGAGMPLAGVALAEVGSGLLLEGVAIGPAGVAVGTVVPAEVFSGVAVAPPATGFGVNPDSEPPWDRPGTFGFAFCSGNGWDVPGSPAPGVTCTVFCPNRSKSVGSRGVGVAAETALVPFPDCDPPDVPDPPPEPEDPDWPNPLEVLNAGTPESTAPLEFDVCA